MQKYTQAAVLILALLFSINACSKKSPSEPGPAATKTATQYVTPADTFTETITQTCTVTPTFTNTPRVDLYEPDNSAGEASALTVGAAAQEHNFYAANDADFITFNGVAGTNYLVRAVNKYGSTMTLSLNETGSIPLNNSWSDGQLWAYMPVYCLANTTYTIEVANFSSAYGEDTFYDLDVIQLPVPVPVNFNTAVDNAPLTFTFTGDGTWIGQSDYSYTGGSAGQSPVLGNAQKAGFTADVTGPCTVKFWWKISSESCCDRLSFSVDGGATGYEITSGQHDWVQITSVINTGGSHSLEWEYVKDTSIACGYDMAWVDGIEVIP